MNHLGAGVVDPTLRIACPCLHSLQRRLHRRLQQLLGITLWIAFAEHGVARHQNFGSRSHHVGNRLRCNATIYFNAIAQSPFRPQVSQPADLMHRSRE